MTHFSRTFMFRIFPRGHYCIVGSLLSSVPVWSFSPLMQHCSLLLPFPPLSFVTALHKEPCWIHLPGIPLVCKKKAVANKPGWHFITRGCELRREEYLLTRKANVCAGNMGPVVISEGARGKWNAGLQKRQIWLRSSKCFNYKCRLQPVRAYPAQIEIVLIRTY